MDIINACVSLAPVPSLSLAFSTFKSLCVAIQRVKWNELQLRALATSVAQLLLTLDREIRAGRLVESNKISEVVDLQTCVSRLEPAVSSC